MSLELVKNESQPQSSLEGSELAELHPQGKSVTLRNGREIVVRPYKFLEFFTALQFIDGLSSAIEGDDLNLIKAFSQHSQEVLGLIKLATKLSDQELGTLETDEGFDLALATYQVNQDFFVQKMAPKFQALADKFQISTSSPGSAVVAETTTETAPQPQPQQSEDILEITDATPSEPAGSE